MKRLLRNSFKLYSILVCIIIILPLPISAAFIRSNYPMLFHAVLFSTGWITWTWIEYYYHRFVLHPGSEKWETGISRSHQHHHRSPGQFETKLYHRILFFIISSALVLISYKLDNYFTLFSGFFWGYAAFCYIHYLLHIKWTKRFMPRHHEFHIAHPCKFTDKCFGVSVMWWDTLFGTNPRKQFSASNKIINFYYKK